MASEDAPAVSCPLPLASGQHVLLAHGGGGRLMQKLIGDVFLPAFANPLLAKLHDGAVFSVEAGRLAFTTDSYVVQPLFFPGGDIGSLAVYGTVNDLAMCGAKPLYLSVGFILEEGFSLELLQRIVDSMAEAARKTQVQLVTGDTKVVDRGKGDGIFINTAGIGVVPPGVMVGPHRVQAGDRILVSGDLGAHGLAVLSMREGLGFGGGIESDSAPLHGVVADLLHSGVDVHCLRDLTRGGLASALNEIATAAKVEMTIEERSIPVQEPVRGGCEILGLDPLYVANEGRFVAFVPPAQAETALAVLRRHAVSHNASVIGTVTGSDEPLIILRTLLGTNRIVDLLSGDQLPRIC
ncbi:MAG: hydrogenase expression/formation protein HypE [Nitrospirae bacterium]|nr:hydrogenase expression/formation protein HypE [Nitrospirota bacterium]